MKKDNSGKVVVISGATSGIGKALAEKYTADGYTVCNLARSCESGGNDYKCDVTDEARVNEVIAEIGAKYGKIDVVINNAGCGISGAMELVPMDKVRAVMDVSYFGALYLTRACLKYMERGGRVIFISSICGLIPTLFHSIYCSAKAAELMLGESLRMELSHTGISVITFCPGEIQTNFTANKYVDSQTNERYGKRVEASIRKGLSRDGKRLSVEKVAKKMYKKCIKGRKAMYIFGGKYKFLHFLQRIMPTTTYLNITNKILSGK